MSETGAASAPTVGLDAIALRLFGWLMLLGAVLLLAALIALTRLPHSPSSSSPGFAVPGSRGHHVVAMGAVWVLAGSSGVLAIIGVVSLWLGRHAPATRLSLRGIRRRPLLVLFGGLAVLAVALLRR